ncbi:hypothetical protein [Methylobacter marinus]|nr:hypothetical protein [Methylobacter marinus]
MRGAPDDDAEIGGERDKRDMKCRHCLRCGIGCIEQFLDMR